VYVVRALFEECDQGTELTTDAMCTFSEAAARRPAETAIHARSPGWKASRSDRLEPGEARGREGEPAKWTTLCGCGVLFDEMTFGGKWEGAAIYSILRLP
jgi:hypothetical protein